MKELTLEAKIENLPAATAFVEGELEALGCPPRAQMQIDVALDELFSNIAHYAYAPGAGPATLRFDFDPEARLVSLTLIDCGAPYDPLAREDPDTSLPAEERGIGGLGIFLVKKTMDGMSYRRENGMNMLTIQKRI